MRCEADLVVVDAGYQSPPAATPVTLHYARKDIEELDRKARERNDHLSATRSFIYLSQILSSIGTHVGDKGGSLLSLSNIASTETVPVIDIEYETVQSDQSLSVSRTLTFTDSVLKITSGEEEGQGLNDNRYSRFSSLQ